MLNPKPAPFHNYCAMMTSSLYLYTVNMSARSPVRECGGSLADIESTQHLLRADRE